MTSFSDLPPLRDHCPPGLRRRADPTAPRRSRLRRREQRRPRSFRLRRTAPYRTLIADASTIRRVYAPNSPRRNPQSAPQCSHRLCDSSIVGRRLRC
jgi:hypothetical protein